MSNSRHEDERSQVNGSTQPPEDLRRQVADGLFYTHVRLSQGTNKTLETSAFLYALIELLSEQGLISVEELDKRKKEVGERLVAQLEEKGLGVMLQDPDEDKYRRPKRPKHFP